MKPSTFDYHAPDTVEEAVALLTEFGDVAKVLAGGQSLVPMLSLRLAYFDHLIDIGRIPSLRGIHVEDDALMIGATTLDATVEHDADVASALPLLTRSTPFIGHFQIRNRGTLGGSIAHADPAGEYPAVALALDAQIHATSGAGTRIIPATDFFQGFWTSALAPDEILVGVRFPMWSGRCGFGVREFARRYGDFAMAGAVVAVELDDDDRIRRCAIGLLGLGSVPIRAFEAESAVIGRSTDVDTDELGHAAVSDLADVPADHHGSSAYRRRVGASMVSRALTDALSEATSV